MEYNNETLKRLAREIRMVVFDFDGVFTDNRVLVMQDGTEGVFCSRSDGFGLKALKDLGIIFFVLSTETNPVVGARCNKLGMPCIQGCDDKLSVLRMEASKAGIPLQNVAYLGNDINDLECMRIVGLPACVADAYPDVVKEALYVTKAYGGRGAVREFCDFLESAKSS